MKPIIVIQIRNYKGINYCNYLPKDTLYDIGHRLYKAFLVTDEM